MVASEVSEFPKHLRVQLLQLTGVINVFWTQMTL